jgi:hypothetical protein
LPASEQPPLAAEEEEAAYRKYALFPFTSMHMLRHVSS